MEDLSVIIPTFSNIEGLKYLAGFFKDKNCHVIVVDNQPSDEKKAISAGFTYLPQQKNLGFAAVVNHGARHVKTKWMVILNDDIEFQDGRIFLDLLAEATRKELDALSPILINPDGRIENYGYRVLSHGQVELVTDQNDKNIDGLTAACLLIRTDVFKNLKGFDESFFAYLEDVDFFMRFKKAGYKMAMSNEDVRHNHMTTSKTMGNFKSRQDMFNWWRLYLKHSDEFVFDLEFLVERLKNVSGYLKATFRSG